MLQILCIVYVVQLLDHLDDFAAHVLASGRKLDVHRRDGPVSIRTTLLEAERVIVGSDTSQEMQQVFDAAIVLKLDVEVELPVGEVHACVDPSQDNIGEEHECERHQRTV